MYMIYIYIYIYIYIIYISELKNTHNLLKPPIFLFFSEALPMCNQIKSENTFKNTYRIREIIVKGQNTIVSLRNKIVWRIS